MTREEWAKIKLGTTVSRGEGSLGLIKSWFIAESDPEYVFFIIEDYLGYPWTLREKFLRKYQTMDLEEYRKTLTTEEEIGWKDGEEYRNRIRQQIEKNSLH